MINFLEFKNIKEIKFTRVGENIFSITINSDIEKEKNNFKNSVFEVELCKIDSTLELKFQNEYLDVPTNDGYLIRTETFNIPINIQLLLNKELQKFFTIKKGE